MKARADSIATAGGIAVGAATLLVAVEPPGAGDDPSAAALRAEGRRVARALGAEPRFVTWPSEAAVDLETLADALATAASQMHPGAVLMADTDLGRQLAPMTAYRLRSGAVVGCSDVTVRDGIPAFVKPVYGGWLERDIDPAAGSIPVVTLDLSGMEEAAPPSDEAPIPDVLDVPALEGPPRIRSLELIPPDARSVDLVHARRIVGAGSGSVGEGLLPVVQELAELLEGSMGATRPVVDDGLLPKERLIGQTGRTVTPDLYLALGISGSPHHVAGVRGTDRILAVNRDPRAPIFQFSDIGYVADLETVLPALVQRIKDWRDTPGSSDE